MKRIVSMLLCFLLMMQMVVFAQSDSTQVTYELVSTGAKAYRLNRSNTGNTVMNDQETRLTDGQIYVDNANSAGFGINTIPAMTWIDLGEAKQIDKVIIYCRDGRSVGQEYYLSNTAPSHSWTASDGVLLGTKGAFTDEVSASEYILTGEQAGSYRYVIVKTETGVGGYITEIEAYKAVSSDDGGDDNTDSGDEGGTTDSTQVTYELVSTGAASYQYDVYDNVHTSKSTNLSDGDTATIAGWGAILNTQVSTRTNDRFVYIDLDSSMMLHRVAFYTTSARSNGVEFYLSNSKPSTAWTAATDGVLLGTLSGVANDDVFESDFILTDTQKGTYRYAIVRVPCTSGGYVCEIKAYKDAAYVAPDGGGDEGGNEGDDSGDVEGTITYESVTADATSCKSGATATAENYERDAQNRLVDGDADTVYGTGPVGDAYFTFLDLGEGGKRVDKVVITTSDSRTVGQKYYLADTIPVIGADRTNWVEIGTRTEVGTMTFILTEAQAGTYRYIVADCTSATVGGYVNEIEVYKDAAYVAPDNGGDNTDGGDEDGNEGNEGNEGDNPGDDTTVYESVTNNGKSCKSGPTATAATIETDAQNKMLDGDTATSYGTGPVGDAYFTFVDLGEGGRRVDKVVITTSDTRTVGQVYYLADTVPVNGADRTNWVQLGTRTAVGTMTFVLTEAQAGNWRYIVADCTSPTVGGYVNEIEAYMNPAVFEEEMKAAFATVTAETALDLINSYPDVFDVNLRKELNDAESETGTVGESFMMAKEALTSALVNDTLTDWSKSNSWIAAAKAALIIDATINGDEIEKLVTKYGDTMPKVFGNEDFDSEEIDDILPSVVTAMQPETLSDVLAVYNRATALSLIANGTEEEREKALTNYASALGIQSATLSGTTYTAAEISKQFNVNISVITSTYAGGMDASVQQIITWLGTVENSGTGTGATIVNGGGSGGGGGGARAEISSPKEEEVSAPADDTTEKNESTAPAFKDLSAHGWAQPYIESLAARGIVSGKGNGVFDPNGLLTREETVKMLILVSGLTTDRTDNAFLDCDKDEWYYPYVTAATANGLVNGFSIVTFGLGQNVSRQDLAVMLYRVLIKKELVQTENSVTFTDADSIADYAETAVEVLGGMGIIGGFEDGSFKPEANATRAEAAVIFGRFMEIMDAAETEAAK